VGEAFRIREKINSLTESHAELRSDSHDNSRRVENIDFLNPSPEMINQAATMGLDLNDDRSVCWNQ